MSHSCDDTYDVYQEQERRARKAHDCEACGERIPPGHKYYVVSLVFERTAESIKRCLKCQEIHEHLRELAPGETWPDERLNCGERYESEWGECPPEIVRLAFMTAEEAQRELLTPGGEGKT